MNFLFPAFLIASAAIAIPIIIHLFNFRRYKKVFFPNIQFLKEVKQQTTHQNKLKHLLVMACRILAILFAVFAFAQPFIKNNHPLINKEKQIVSIYLDNSFSMNSTKNGVPLIEITKHKSDEIIDAYNSTTQFQIISNEMTGSQQHLVGKEEAKKIVDEIKITPASPFLNEIIAKQKQAIAFNGNKNAQCYLISDFQKSQLHEAAIKQDTNYNALATVLSADEKTNVSIDSCWFDSPIQTINQSVKLFVKISNYNPHSINNNRLTLSINNQLKFLGDVNLGANATITDTIPFTVTNTGWNKCVLNINDNPITFDDNYYFCFEVLNTINVMSINGEKENQFLKALYANDVQIHYTNQSFSQIDFNYFNHQQCILLNGLQSISSGLGSELQKFVQKGGSLIIFPDENIDVLSYNTFLSLVHAGAYNTLSNKEQSVNAINHEADVFKNVFLKVSDNMELPKAKKYYPISFSILNAHEALLTMKDGNDLMSKFQFEKGNVYICGVPLNKAFSDLPFKAIFVPMVLKMSFSGIHLAEMSYVIGKNNHIQIPAFTNKSEPTYLLKNKLQEFIPEQINIENNLYLHIRNEVNQAGIFELIGTSDSLKPSIAFNFNRNESNMNFYSTPELEEKLLPLNIRVLDASHKNLTTVVGEINHGIVLWKIFLVLALLFLLIEVLLLRFWKI